MANLTVTLHIDPNNVANNHATYDPPDKTVKWGDSVVFKVVGSTAVFIVNFPDGSPLVSGLNNFQVGGQTLASQSTPQEQVAKVPEQDYRFTATPQSSTPPASRLGGEYDTPGTVAGDLEVVPDTRGNDDKKPKGR
ncbi:hypothetical protein JRI60_03340 [Archangium violaceum]|uniref:hypothetical protein n=1 Tax=Archangium violaceum TaxID=83451 RepID=UPI00194E156C|nr:hypothetical protein [Archangium violaceum]QRN98123.1 hypothetical protein JRI60_03340 [Archangium violaceum]